jgi:hypothetical protein
MIKIIKKIFSERIIASKWVKKFLECDPKDYKHNLSLFVNSLTKRMLVEPFNKIPFDVSSTWQDFGKEYTFKDINSKLIQQLYKDVYLPPFQLDMSENMKEITTFQEIPFFGAHFYYAFSPRETVDKWTNFNKMNFTREFIKEFLEDESEELPINVRLHPRYEQHRTFYRESKATLKQKKKVQTTVAAKKPEWEGPIREEPEEIESEAEKPKPMISIVLGGPIKNIPPALQRRMIQAEKESKIKNLFSKDNTLLKIDGD